MAKGNKKKKSMIPKLKKEIDNFLLNEEGKIARKNIAKLGISLAILGLILESNNSAYAGHDSYNDSYNYYDHSSAFFATDTGGHNSADGTHHDGHYSYNDGGHSSAGFTS